ncbi:aspartate 1-decarboxylase [Streptomyces sp. NPDC101150]|uniref:aspartate 1-decarboxylase n=1 Tax=Streptomyces sp. NPDC101150 TaxID=3366114 RepID=UPI00381E1A35
MYFETLKAKIHRATVTQSHLNYVGSITIDVDLMEAAGIRRHEKVDLVNLNNGARLSTYVIEGPRGSGVIGVNGPSARQAQVGDLVLIVSFASVTLEEADIFEPKVVFVDAKNKITGFGGDAAEVPPGSGLVRGDQIAGA